MVMERVTPLEILLETVLVFPHSLVQIVVLTLPRRLALTTVLFVTVKDHALTTRVFAQQLSPLVSLVKLLHHLHLLAQI